MEKWYYSKKGEQFGPLTFEQMLQMLVDGSLAPETMVRSESSDEWTPAYDVAGFGLDAPAEKETEERTSSLQMESVATELPPVRPWVRFFARWIDVNVWSLLLGLILPLYLLNMLMVSFVSILTWVFIEAVLLATWGTTIGKAILGVRLTDEEGGKLGFRRALSRSLSVWVKGMGLGIQLVMQVLWLIGFVQLTRHGTTWWDRDAATTVTHAPLNPGRVVGAIAVVAVLMFINMAGMIAMVGGY